MLGKPVEILAMRHGQSALTEYLADAGAAELRDYVPLVDGTLVAELFPETTRGHLTKAIPDDDVNYSVLALMLMEEHGRQLETVDVARAWLKLLPGGMTFTAEREAYVKLLADAGMAFALGAPSKIDLAECSDNPYNDWIGAQIRTDVYGWVTPGEVDVAARLATADAALSHRGEGVHGAVFVAVAGSCLAGGGSIAEAVEVGRSWMPDGSDCAAAVDLAIAVAERGDGPDEIHATYDGMSPVHTVNNLALVVWGLLRGADDFSVAIGDTVAAGWDTDCNGATVGALWGLTGRPLPSHWTEPWGGRIETTLAGVGELTADDLVSRTVAVAAATG